MSSEPNWLEFFEDRERRYASYYLNFARQYARRDSIAYDNLEAESGNLLKTAGWLAEQNKAEDILKLAEALWQQSDFLYSRGFIQRGLPLLEQAHQAAHQLRDTRAEFTWLEALAYVHVSTGNHALAKPLYEQALTLAQDIDEPQFIAQVQYGKGRLLMDMNDLEQAGDWLRRALQAYRQLQDYKGEITTLTALGNLLSLQGDSDGAVAYLEQGLPLVQAKRDRYGEVALRFALGYVGTATQNWPMAIMYYEPVIEMARAIGDRFLEVRGLTNLGEAWLELGETQQAVNLLEDALARQKTSDDILTKTATRFCLAKAYYVLNDPEKSLAQLKQVNIFRQIPIVVDIAAEAAWIEAECYLKQNNTDAARIALQDVLNLAPDGMADIRQAAQSLLKSIERGDSDTMN